MLFYKPRKVILNKRNTAISLICLAVLVSLTYISWDYLAYYFADNTKKYDIIIHRKSKKYNLDPLLIKAVIWRESRFTQNITGSKGEIGLMQIMPSAALQDWEESKRRKINHIGALYSPSLNIEIGCWYIARCRRHWKDYNDSITLTLAEYNAGYSNVKRWVNENDKSSRNLIDRIGFPSTKKYVCSILKKYRELKKE